MQMTGELLKTDRSAMGRSSRLQARKLCMVAVMTTLAVMGRVLFAALPGFKPVTAIVILSGMYFGPGSGLATGALAALVSNIYFTQGPWTPFQMLAWGIIGLISGLLSRPLIRHPLLLYIWGALSGVCYYLFMDSWMILWYNKTPTLQLWLAAFATGVFSLVTYVISNVVFLAALSPAMGRRLLRISRKCGFKTGRHSDPA